MPYQKIRIRPICHSRILVLSFLLTGTIHSQCAERVANTTLTFPQEPYSYALQSAFPGVFFDSVIAMTSPPGDTNRLFVVERTGTIYVIDRSASTEKSIFLDLTGRVYASGEGGLLGLAFHPGYETNRQFFVYYTLQTSSSAGYGFHDRLSRFETSPTDPGVALNNSEVPFITQYDRAENHNGGDLHFGPDGYLYVSLGDEGGGSDIYGNSRRIDRNFFAGILRIDVDKRPGSLVPNAHPAIGGDYNVPPDNPFVGVTSFNGAAVNPAAVRTEFWAVGLRNPWRFSFDPANGRLFCGDVGEDAREEINLVEKGGDYGWNRREGSLPVQGNPPSSAGLMPPIWEYGHGSGEFEGMSVVGGVVYRGAKIPELQGSYIFGDYISGNIWSLVYDGSAVTGIRRIAGLVGVCNFGIDPANGDVLLAQPWFGSIQRLVRNVNTSPLPSRLSDTGAFQNLATLAPAPGVVSYEINTPFWSDHAKKRRWFSVPDPAQTIAFSANDRWTFPAGAVWVKHFDLELTNGMASSARRIETRFLVKNESGVYGLTYKWNASQTDATLVAEDGADELFEIRDGAVARSQVWHYPSRSECLACHAGAGGFAAGFTTHQLNRSRAEGGSQVNQILWLSQMGYFDTPVTSTNGLLAFSPYTDTEATLDQRVRSYLGANCSYCHQPDGTGYGHWDGRFSTSWEDTGLINGPLIRDLGDPRNRVIRPGNVGQSMIYARISELGVRHMPPLGTEVLDTNAIALLQAWINSGLDGAQITSARLGANQQMHLAFDGSPGRSYRIETSDMFGPWTRIGTAEVSGEGKGEFIDPQPVLPGSQVRLYRCAWP